MSNFNIILADQNLCSLTSIETKVKHNYPNLKIYTDQHSRKRLVAYNDDLKPVAGLLIEPIGKHRYIIKTVYTVPESRRMAYASSLLVIAKLLFKNIRHSDHLTEEGEKWRDSVEGYHKNKF